MDRLVVDHLPLVGHIAREAAARLPRHLDSDDLVGAGSLALVQAAHAFDPGLGVPFGRFAATRVRGAMVDSMRSRDWATRSVRSRSRALAAAAEQLTAALHRAPTDDELAAASGMSVAEVRRVRAGVDRAVLVSLEPTGSGTAAEGSPSGGPGAHVADGGPQPDEALVAAERMGYLRDAVAELPERVRHVVTGYYLQDRPLTELADELGVTSSRASQLRAEGLELLQQALRALLSDDARAGAGATTDGRAGHRADGRADGGADATRTDGARTDGTRERRREEYVQAVAGRSSVRERVDVQAYLAGSALTSPDRSRGNASTPVPPRR